MDDSHKFLLELEKQRTKSIIAGSIIPQLAGFFCVLGGVVLFFLGVGGAGSTDLLVESGGFKATLINASPGVFLILVGALILVLSTPR